MSTRRSKWSRHHLAAFAFSVLDENGDGLETERLPDLVFDEALVTFLDAIGGVRPRDEERRRRLGLRHVVDARRTSTVRRRWLALERVSKETVQRRRRDAAVDLFGGSDDGSSELVGSCAGFRGKADERRPAREGEHVASVLEGRLPLVSGNHVDLVEPDDDGPAALDAESEQARVLLGYPFGRVA